MITLLVTLAAVSTASALIFGLIWARAEWRRMDADEGDDEVAFSLSALEFRGRK